MTAGIEKLAKLIPQAMDFGGTVEQVISSSVYGYNYLFHFTKHSAGATRGFHRVMMRNYGKQNGGHHTRLKF